MSLSLLISCILARPQPFHSGSQAEGAAHMWAILSSWQRTGTQVTEVRHSGALKAHLLSSKEVTEKPGVG